MRIASFCRDAPGLEMFGDGEHVVLAKGVLELGKRAERQTKPIALAVEGLPRSHRDAD